MAHAHRRRRRRLLTVRGEQCTHRLDSLVGDGEAERRVFPRGTHAQRRAGRHDEALDALTRAVQFAAPDAAVLQHVADYGLIPQHFDAGVLEHRTLLASILAERAATALKLGLSLRALADTNAALALGPYQRRASFLRALALLSIGACAAARRVLAPCLAAERYNKDEAYGKSYGQLAGDDMVQKSWAGLTCDRTDDDKWGWGEAKATADNSGTNCVYGDSWFCEEHYDRTDDGEMTKISDLLWYYCNSTCNSTDENRVSAYGSDAV